MSSLEMHEVGVVEVLEVRKRFTSSNFLESAVIK